MMYISVIILSPIKYVCMAEGVVAVSKREFND